MASGVDFSGLTALGTDFQTASRQVIPAIARTAINGGAALASAIRAELPVRTGRTRDSVRLGAPQNFGQGVVVEVDVGGAGALLLTGTRAHEIVAHGRALVWESGGSRHFAHSVHHPGTEPNDWADRALARLDYGAVANVAIDEITRTAFGVRS